MLTQSVFQTYMNKLMDRFATRLKPDQLTQYWEALKDLDNKAFASAISSLIDNDSIARLPLPVHIERLAKRLSLSQDCIYNKQYLPNRLSIIQRHLAAYSALLQHHPTERIKKKVDWLTRELEYVNTINFDWIQSDQ